MRRLPGLLAEIEDVVGRKAALAIAIGYGGLTKTFPSPDHLEKSPERYAQSWLVATVGHDLALRIVREIFPNGGAAEIPNASSLIRQKFVKDNHDTLSVSEMATLLGITERGVRRIKTVLRREGIIP